MVCQTLTLLTPDNSLGEVCFVAHQHYHDVRIGLLLDILEPSLNIIECLFSGNVIDYDSSTRPSVVPTSQWVGTPWLWIDTVPDQLSSVQFIPVSHICALTLSPFLRATVLVANSTPMVGTGLRGRIPFTYLFSRCVFPTPVSPTKITNCFEVYSYRAGCSPFPRCSSDGFKY